MSDESGHGRSVAVAIGEPRGRLAWPEDVERFFHRAMRDCFSMWPWLHLSGRRRRFWRREERLPDVDFFERKGQIVMRADLRGRKTEDIDVLAQRDRLVVHSRREAEVEIYDQDCCELAAGEFTRGIRLPQGIHAEAIGASYRNGVLEVTIPRPSAPETKMITLQAE
jgi:HSP20 family molecular chaperone IbpA